MYSFEIIDLILFLGISQGFFLAIALRLINNRNKSANKILSYSLFIAALMLLGRVLSSNLTNIFLYRIASFADTFIFIFGPLIYMYVRRLTFKEYPEFKLSFLHFIPALLHTAYFFWTLLYSLDEFRTLLKSGGFTEIYALIEGTGIVSNIYYCLMSYRLVKVFGNEAKNKLSYSQNVTPFLKAFLFSILVFLVAWSISYINSYYMKIPSLYFMSYHVVWICIPIYIYVVGFYSLQQPEIFRVPNKRKKEIVNKERLEGEVLEKLNKNLERLIVDEKIYLNNNLTLGDLSEKLGTSSNNVSWLLNNIHKCSFYDYINRYRVKAFIEKIQNGEHNRHTLLALSLDSGFNSKSTFNKAFKMEMKETPTNYIKKLTSSY